MRALELE